MAIRNEAAEQIDEKIHNTAVTGVFDLRYVLELIATRFDNRSFSEQQ